MLLYNKCPPRTDHRFQSHDLDLSRYQVDIFPISHDLAHVTGWHRHNLHDLGYVPWLDVCCCTDPAQHITTLGWDLDGSTPRS